MSDDEWSAACTTACLGAVGTGAQRQRLWDILQEYRGVFGTVINCFEPMVAEPIRIYTVHSAPIRARGRRFFSAEQHHFINAEVQRLCDLGVLEPSMSQYDSPPVLVKKSNGNYRLCHDFRALNRETIPHDAIIPTIDEVLRELAGSQVFSKMDCTSGYFQLVIEPVDRPKTAFRCQLGTFHYRVAPFGLRNLPAAFNAAVARILHDMWRSIQHYFDDLIVHSRTVDEHLDALEQVLQRCRDNNIQLSIEKSRFLQPSLDILGVVVGGGAMRIPPKALQAVHTITSPRNQQELMTVLGLMGYYMSFVPAYADRAAPLTELLAHGVVWQWDRRRELALQSLKETITSDPVLQLPRRPGHHEFTPFVVRCDASNVAVAGVLTQQSPEDGKMHPCAFWSRKLRAAEVNYTTTERECLAVLGAIQRWRAYLVDAPFVVETDHMALTFLLTARDLEGRLARWVLQLQQYTFTIRHRKGVEMREVDALSRLPREDDELSDNAAVLVVATAGHADHVCGEGLAAELEFVRPEVCPTQADASLDGPDRPAMVKRRSADSVLLVTRSQSKRQQQAVQVAPTGAAGLPGSAATVNVSAAAEAAATTTTATPVGSGSEAGGSPPVDATMGGEGPTAAARAALWPSSPVWHSEPWLSTALHQRLRTGLPVPGLPAAVAARVEADAREYTATFQDGKNYPVAIGRYVDQGAVEGKPRAVLGVPPPCQRLEIVAAAHEVGHFGVDKTCDRIRDLGWTWQGLRKDAQALIERCVACQQDAAHRLIYHPLQSISIPKGVFDRVHMDILELPVSRDGLRYVLLFVDALSKFPIAFAQKTKDMHTVATNLWHVITMFGPPVILCSDNGLEFVNKAVLELQQLHGITRRLITAYRPQANGQVERYNRVLCSILRKVSGSTPDLWPEWLDFAMLAIRTATSASTGFSPFQVMFGRDFHPLANYAVYDWAALLDDEAGLDSLARRVVEAKMLLERQERAIAHETAAAAARRQAAQADNRLTVAAQRLAPGTPVFLRVQQPSHKLQHRFEGPFTIVESVADGNNYRLRNAQGVDLLQTFPRDMVFEVPQQSVQLSLRQQQIYGPEEMQQAVRRIGVVRPGPFPRGAQPRQGGEGSVGDTWAVECIKDVREGKGKGKKGEEEVLVKWVGYEECEWIPASAFEPDDLVELKRRWVLAGNRGKRRVGREE